MMRFILMAVLVCGVIQAEDITQLTIVKTYLNHYATSNGNVAFNRLTIRLKEAEEEAEKADRSLNSNSWVNEVLLTWVQARKQCFEANQVCVVDRLFLARMYVFYLNQQYDFPEELQKYLTVKYFKEFFQIK
jgi:hypothetical protein